MGRGGLFIIAGLLLMVGAGLLALAAATPWHSDAEAYFAGLAVIRQRLYADQISFDAASDAFHDLQRRFRTAKWLLADYGYVAVAWGLLAGAAGLARPDRTALLSTRRWWMILGVTILGVCLLSGGFLAASLQLIGRQQIPEWADTLAIAMMGTGVVLLLCLPIFLAFALAPLVFVRRPAAPLWTIGTGWLRPLVVSLIYLPPIAFSLFLITALAAGPGGWAISVSGALLTWAMLNSRALWLGPKQG
jgi:hypothetical protein